MKKKLIGTLLCFGVSFMLFGCASEKKVEENTAVIVQEEQISEEMVMEQEEKKLSNPDKIMNSDLLICCEQHDYKILSNVSSFRDIMFDVYSFKTISNDNFQVDIEMETPYEVVVGEEEEVEFSKDILKRYNPDESEETIENEYQKIMNNIDKLHKYSVVVRFDMSEEELKNESFTDMQIIYKDEIYNQNIGEVAFDYETELTESGDVIESNVIALYDCVAVLDENDTFEFDAIQFEVADNVVIKDIKLLNFDHIKIQKADVNSIVGEQSVDTVWEKGNSVKVEKESHVVMNVLASYEASDKNTDCFVNPIWVVTLEVDGKESVEAVESIIHLKSEK